MTGLDGLQAGRGASHVWPTGQEEEEGSRQTVGLEKELVGWACPPTPCCSTSSVRPQMGTGSVVLLGSRRQLESRGGQPLTVPGRS